jgi:signal-transduction protein with cAMP-binding, CBS, and nucleotidyltransferase domain
MSAAASLMLAQGKGAVVISDHDVLADIFTERDVSLRVVATGLASKKTALSQVMTRYPITIDASDTALQALANMHIRNFRHFPVMNNVQLIDIVLLKDIYACANAQLEQELGQMGSNFNLCETILSRLVGSQRLVTFGSGTTVLEAAQAMAERDIGSVLIVDDGKLTCIFIERDVSLRVVAGGLDTQTAILRQVMTADPTKVGPTKSAAMSWT